MDNDARQLRIAEDSNLALTSGRLSSDDPLSLEGEPGIVDLLSKLLLTDEGGRRSFMVVLEGRRLIELSELERPIGGIAPDSWLSMSEAAAKLRHGYFWLSRNWRRLGLRPRKIGRVLFFRDSDVGAAIEKQRPEAANAGRKRKVIGIISHAKS